MKKKIKKKRGEAWRKSIDSIHEYKRPAQEGTYHHNYARRLKDGVRFWYGLCLLLLCSTLPAAPPEVYLKLENIQVIDGDTIKADVRLPFGITVRDKIRASDFDAYEKTRKRVTIGTITDDELARGARAADQLASLLKRGSVWLVPLAGKDAYGRRLGRWYVEVDGNLLSVAEWAKANGHTRTTDGH